MKQLLCLALVFALSAAVLAGCGCTSSNVSGDPNGMITKSTTVPTTNPMPTMTTPPEETTRETILPTTDPTIPGEMPGELPDITGDTTPTDITGTHGRSRGIRPRG